MASPTGVALQVHSSECRKGRLENQGLKITLDYPAALKPARAAGDPVSKKKKQTQEISILLSSKGGNSKIHHIPKHKKINLCKFKKIATIH